MLVHLVDVSGATGRDPVADLDTRAPRAAALRRRRSRPSRRSSSANKIDAAHDVDDAPRIAALERRAAELGLPFFRISGVTGAGVPDLLEAMWQRLASSRQSAA